MKKWIALALSLCLALGCTSALAAGKLTVVQETYTPARLYSDTYAGYIFAEVTNSGDKNIEFANGIFEILTEDGEALESSDIWSCYPQVLAPGETGYISRYDTVDDATSAADIPDYTLTVSGKSTQEEAPARIKAEAAFEEIERWGDAIYQVTVTLTNETEETVYEPVVVFALYDADGRLLYADMDQVYSVGIPAGQRVEVLLTVSDSLMEVWQAAGTKAATVQAIAYLED